MREIHGWDVPPLWGSAACCCSPPWRSRRIDIWGRIRRETEAARAQYWAAEAVRRGILLTLVSDVAQAYFDLLELDRELEITRRTVDTFSSTLDLFNRRYQGRIGTLLGARDGA